MSITYQPTLEWLAKQTDEQLVEIWWHAGRINHEDRQYWLDLLPKLRKGLSPEVTAIQAAYDHLMNLQPLIAQLPKEYQGFIDPHVDEAMKLLASCLPQG